MFQIHRPCGTALLLFPASVGFVVPANWVWNKVCAVTQPVASAVISGTQGEVGADGAHYCNMINHNNFLSNKRVFILRQLFLNNYRFHYTLPSAFLFFPFTSKDNSACELISSSEVKDIIIFHLHSAKKHAFK